MQVVASSLDTLEPVLLEGFESKEDLVACLKASANVPRIAGEPLQHRYCHSQVCSGLRGCPRYCSVFTTYAWHHLGLASLSLGIT